MAQIIGDKLFGHNEEIPCRTREDVDIAMLKIDPVFIRVLVFFTAKMGDTELLKYILEKMDTLDRYFSYDLIIYYAAISGKRDTVEYVFHMASMAEYHTDWNCAIQGAVEGGHLELVKEYEQRAIINEENIKWEYYLMYANDIQIAKYICEKILISGGKVPVELRAFNEEVGEYLKGLNIE